MNNNHRYFNLDMNNNHRYFNLEKCDIITERNPAHS